jgi:hypothetical protein
MMPRFSKKNILPMTFFLLSAVVPQMARSAVHHELSIRLDLGEHTLCGTDRIEIRVNRNPHLLFVLSERATIEEVKINDNPCPFIFEKGKLHIPLAESPQNGPLTVWIRYEGVFNDTVPIAPANSDNPGYGVSGVISEKGCFLQAGAGWYPEIPGSLSTYLLQVDAPAGVIAVTAGKSLGRATKNA